MKLIGIGGGHIDRRGRIAGDYVAGASNPGSMREDIGGGTLNALRNAVQRGLACSLVSVRGGDAAGDRVAHALAEAGIADLSATFLDRATPSYTALLDRNGELIAGFADMGLYDLAFPKQLRRSSIRDAIGRHDAVLCDANVPQAGLERLVAASGDRPVFAIGVSPAKIVRMRVILPSLACMFMNVREALALADIAEGGPAAIVGRLRAIGLRAGVITSGEDEVTIFDADSAHSLRPPSSDHVVDVTGAGDALAGVTISALVSGLPLAQAAREGVAAALIAVECAEAVPRLEPAAFAARLALVPPAEPMA